MANAYFKYKNAQHFIRYSEDGGSRKMLYYRMKHSFRKDISFYKKKMTGNSAKNMRLRNLAYYIA